MAEETYTRIWLSTGSDFSVKGHATNVLESLQNGAADSEGAWFDGVEGLPVYVSAEACSKLLVLLEQRRDIAQERINAARAQQAMAGMALTPMPPGMRLS